MKTYKEQFDKLTEAYIKNEVEPLRDCACFVGNLLNRRKGWSASRTWNGGMCVPFRERVQSSYYESTVIVERVLREEDVQYTPDEILELERVFLQTYMNHGGPDRGIIFSTGTATEEEENALFIAFEKTLDLLKAIHIKHGEEVDKVPTFIKREKPVLCK